MKRSTNFYIGNGCRFLLSILRPVLIAFFCTVLILSVGSVPVRADDGNSSETADYSTENFNTEINIDEDHTIHVSETIKVNFNTGGHHGIYRYIPYSSKLYRVRVNDCGDQSYNTDTTSNSSGDFMVVRIGDEDRTVYGEQTYYINYDLICYVDNDSQKDYLAVDLFPTGWETSVGSVSTTLKLPKSIDWNAVKLYGGSQGSTSELPSYFTTSIDQSSNTLYLTGANVPANSGATITADLDEGYWVNPPNSDWSKIPFFLILIAVPVIVILLWIRHRKGPKVVPTVEFYPPEGMTPCDVGYILDGWVDNKDIFSMLMYYANKGWVSFEEKEKGKLVCIKEKDIDKREASYSRYWFHRLFRRREKLKLYELPGNIDDAVMKTRIKIESWYDLEDNRIFDEKARTARMLSYFLMFIYAFATSLFAGVYDHNIFECFYSLITAGLLIAGMYFINKARDRAEGSKMGRSSVRIVVGALLSLGGIVLSIYLYKNWLDSYIPGIAFAIGAVLIVVFSTMLHAYTERGAELTGKILGFKEFIRTAEYDRLKMLSEENPTYFFDILPYAYIFNMDETWAKKFDSIKIPQPDWYRGYDDNMLYSPYWCSSLMHSYSKSFADEIHHEIAESAADSASDSGFGGGDFSGGGFGGGGGGAW